jgi:lipopolysaccharide export system protein LptA
MRGIPIILALALAPLAQAEKADKDKPTQIEANRMSADDTRKVNVFEGNVVLTKGTLAVRADRIVVRQDAEGFQQTTATGSPVRFKQRMDPKEGENEARWLDGEARRIELNDREQKVELFDAARVNRGGDEVTGDYIFVDQASDFFSVSSGKKGEAGGRVKAVIQPKAAPDATKK